MISTDISIRPVVSSPAAELNPALPNYNRRIPRKLHFMTWVCLLLACFGAGWFAFQYFLVPQTRYFPPDWHGAQWVQAADGGGAIAYFHYETDLQAVPDNAFVTIAADQVFTLYVNGILVDSSGVDFGNYPRAYMYDITSLLATGTNVLAIRVDNLDRQIPMLRASLSVVVGGNVSYDGTGPGWVSTTQVALVYPQDTAISTALNAWTGKTFNTDLWKPVTQVIQPPITPSLVVNPLLYEQPVSDQWASAGASGDAFFVQKLSLPQDLNTSWFRIASTGMASVFINGNAVTIWDSQPSVTKQVIVDRATGQRKVQYSRRLMLGIYDVSSYLHPGLNTIAIHVTSENIKGILDDPATANAELSMDMLSSNDQGRSTWLSFASRWQASPQATPGWEAGGNATKAWNSPIIVGQPESYRIAYTQQSNASLSSQESYQPLAAWQLAWVIIPAIGIVLVLWLLNSLALRRRYFSSQRNALEIMSLAYLPALALEGLLIVCSKEPQIAQPFPYTRFWGIALMCTVGAGYVFLWLHVLLVSRQRVHSTMPAPHKGFYRLWRKGVGAQFIAPLPGLPPGRNSLRPYALRLLNLFRNHWAIIPVVLIAIPLIFYNLGYEAYWQDELVSYYVANSILHTGLPLLPSGFYYPKAELYSYMLALSMKIFGDQGGGPRVLSAAECVMTIVLIYRTGCHFFDRRVALVAALMLALSPQELLWGRQERMYQQAQLFTLLTVYLFYRALQERHRVHLVYLAAASLIVTYLSHEETFIILPALAICILLIGFMTREKGRILPYYFYQKHWYIATAIVVTVIGLQLLSVQVTHPPVLGTDRTWRPMVQLTTDNISYYYGMLFYHSGSYQAATNQLIIYMSILLNSLLAVLGCVWAGRSKDLKAKYVALFFTLSFLALVFLFTMQSNRYFYPIATLYYLMGAYALLKILRAFWNFAHSQKIRWHKGEMASSMGHSFPLKIVLFFASALVCLSVLIMPMLPLDNYSLFVSRTFGIPYYRHYADYEETGQFVQSHLRKGDIVISIIPDTIVMYYVGQSDYFFSFDRALFLFEKDGQVVDTYSGHFALLRQSDFDAVLAMHTRIWLISANSSYQADVLKRFTIPPGFHVVYAEPNSIVYLRGG